MPKYALGDANGLVIAFYDTDADDYPALPPLNSLTRLSEEDWQFRAANFSQGPFSVAEGHLTLAPKSLEIQAIAASASLRNSGITVTSGTNPTMNGTFSLDGTTLDQIGSVARDFGGGLGLPGGLPVFVYPDKTGTPRMMSGQDVSRLYQAMRNFLFQLQVGVQTMKQGGTPDWPASEVILD